MNKPVYLGMLILDISKTHMYGFWYDYIKPKYGDRAELSYMDSDSSYFYEDIANDIERQFDTSNDYENDKRPLPIGKNKKVIGLFKDELGGKIIKEFCALRAKTYAYFMNDDSENKKTKGTEKCVMKRKNMFENYTDSLFNSKIILKSQQRFKGDHHKVYAEEVNKIALCSNDDKRLQIFDRITPYPHETNAFKICENDMLMVTKYKDFASIETNRSFKTIVAKCILNRS